MDMNNCSFVGRLGAAIKYTPGTEGGTASRAVGRLIINRYTKGYDAIPFVCWGKTADAMYKYTTSGKELGISGPLRTRYEKRADGATINYFEVHVLHVSFGRDSNTVKAWKAMEAASGDKASLFDSHTKNELQKIINNNPKIKNIVKEKDSDIEPDIFSE